MQIGMTISPNRLNIFRIEKFQMQDDMFINNNRFKKNQE